MERKEVETFLLQVIVNTHRIGEKGDKRRILTTLALSLLIAGAVMADTWTEVARTTITGNARANNYALTNIDGKLYAGLASGNIMAFDLSTGATRYFDTGTNTTFLKGLKGL